MVLEATTSDQIIAVARTYIGRPYDWRDFDCIHFILDVYRKCDILIPWFGPDGHPPENFHLSEEEFALMPVGHVVFFKRRASPRPRVWTHAAIIFSATELIHCSRHGGNGVRVTHRDEFLETYALAGAMVGATC